MNVTMVLKSILSVVILFAVLVNGLLAHSSFARQIADKCDLTARRQCSSDCTKILACVARIETPILSINCTGNTPYCDNGRCHATPGKCTKKALPSFLCTSVGVFPDPTDCRQSHSCAEVGSQSIMSVCPRGYIFDSKNKLCVTKPSNYDNICKKISCDGVTNDFVTFTANPTYYAYCFTSATGIEHTYMYKCDDENNKVFDVTSKKCRFNCKSIGYFADPMDCSSYYICNGLKFASRRVHCPPNYYFNGTVCLNSKAHCPRGSIVNVTTATSSTTTTMVGISMANAMSSTPTPLVDNSLVHEMSSTPTSIVDNSLVDEMSSTPTPMVDNSLVDETSTISIPTVDSSLVHEMSSTPTPTVENLLVHEMPSTPTPTPMVDSSLMNEMSSTLTVDSSIVDEISSTLMVASSSADELSSTPIADSSFADEISATHELTSTEEVTTDLTTMSSSESSTTVTSTTHEPTTVASQINSTSKKPSIWKHMGLLSVRIGKFLNII